MNSETTDIHRRFEQALETARSEGSPKGIELLRGLAAEAPEHVDAWGNLGYLLQLSGDYRQAADCYEKVIENRPKDWEAYRRLGDCWWALGNRRKAYRSYAPLKTSPLAETTPIRQRLRATEPLGRRLVFEGWSLDRAFCARLLERGFVKRYSREMLGMRRALPAIQASGFSAYVNYLVEHYLREKFDRFPIAPCDLCGGTRFIATFFFLGQKNVRCENCGLEFVERRPPDSMDVLADWYNQDSSIEFMDSFWENDAIFAHRREMLRGLFEKANRPFPEKGERAFEVGCAKGHVLIYLADLGVETHGIETGAKLVRHCRETLGLDVWRSTVREWEPQGGEYDYVFAYHVLEHLDKPSDFFRKAWQALRANGCLIVEVPTPDLPACPFADRLHELHGYGNLGHLHYFTPQTMPKYFEKFGFDLLATYEYNTDPLPSGGFLGLKKPEAVVSDKIV